MKPLLLLPAALLAAILGGPGVQAAPLATYFQEPRAGRIALSPDGTRFAYEEAPTSQRPARLVILALDSAHPFSELPLVAGRNGLDRVAFLQWASAQRLVVGTAMGRVFSLDRDGRNERDCPAGEPSAKASDWPPDGRREDNPIPRFPTEEAPRFLRVVALPAGSASAVVEVDERRYDRTLAAKALLSFAVEAGTIKPLDLPGGWGSPGTYVYNPAGQPRLHLPPRSGEGRVQVFHPHGLFADWQDLDELWPTSGLRFGGRGADAFVLGLGREANVLYVAARLGGECCGIYRVDFTAREMTRLDRGVGDFDRFVPGADPADSPLLREPATGEVLGIRVAGREPGVIWLDPVFLAAQNRLEEDFPGRSVAIESWQPDHRHFAAIVSSDADPGRVFLYNSDRSDLPVELLRRAPRLDRDDLAPAQSFAFRLSDGDVMSGYISVPRTNGSGLSPLLLLLHASAGERALPGYDATAQALAKLGYAVARLNDRGSAGLGSRHARLDRAAGPLGADLTECANWLAGRFAVDANAVGVVGRGEGGRVAAAVVAGAAGRFRVAAALDDFLPQPAHRILTASEQADAIQRTADFLAEHGLAPAAGKKRWFFQ